MYNLDAWNLTRLFSSQLNLATLSLLAAGHRMPRLRVVVSPHLTGWRWLYAWCDQPGLGWVWVCPCQPVTIFNFLAGAAQDHSGMKGCINVTDLSFIAIHTYNLKWPVFVRLIRYWMCQAETTFYNSNTWTGVNSFWTCNYRITFHCLSRVCLNCHNVTWYIVGRQLD